MSKNEPGSQSSKLLQNQKSKFKRHFSPDFDIIAKPDIAPVKITIAVSKKVAKRAVDRNRIRRIIKEAFRKTGTFDKSQTVIVKKNIAGFKSYQVAEKLRKIFLKEND